MSRATRRASGGGRSSTYRFGIRLTQSNYLGDGTFEMLQQELAMLGIGHEQVKAAAQLLILARLLRGACHSAPDRSCMVRSTHRVLREG